MCRHRTVTLNQPRGKEIHVIADNLSTHKTQQVQEFLVAHPAVHLHFTPTYSSWLNQVELWFAKIERDVIARGASNGEVEVRRPQSTSRYRFSCYRPLARWPSSAGLVE